jgi:phosphate:Na+ symporter
MMQAYESSAVRRVSFVTLLCAIAGVSVSALAATTDPSPGESSGIDWLALNMGLFGGLALFLAGLEVLSEGLKKAAGNALRDVLAKLTVNRFMGAFTGAFVTAVLNSSSVTTVLVVGFVTAGVMTLAQSVGVIMGANIGSTMTAQILAFNVAAYSLIPVAVGFFMFFSAKNDRSKYIGMMIMGLGLVFYGMGLMGEAMKPLRTYEPFMEILARMEDPLLGILAGAIFTGLVQSSAATVGIAIAMASEGLLTLPAGIALALGANIGTCVTALLAALGKPVEAVRAAVVHIAFNIAGVLVWLPFLVVLADVAVAISPVATELSGKERLAAEVPRQIANANTLFNVLNTLIFIGFTPWFARLAERLVPERAPSEQVIIEPKFLSLQALEVPSIALENARREIERAGSIAVEMMDDMRHAFDEHNIEKIHAASRRNDAVDILSVEVIKYLGRVRQSILTEDESATQEQLAIAMTNLASLADVMASEIGTVAKTYLEGEYEATSDETREMVEGLWDSVKKALDLAVRAVGEGDQHPAQDVLLLRDNVAELADALFKRHAQRLRADDPKYLERVRLLMTFIEQLRHVYTLTKRIARTQLPVEIAREAA